MKPSSLLLVAILSASSLDAAVYVWNDPARETNAYTASKITNATNASPRADLLASSGFGAVRTWNNTGSEWLAGTAADNGLGLSHQGIMNFSDPSLPDVMFSFSGSPGSTSGSNLNNVSFVSAGSTGLRLVPSSASQVAMTLTIDFGHWNGTTFDGSVNSVSAAGFTLTSTGSGRWVTSMPEFTVTFLDASGNVLSTQGRPADWPPNENSQSLYFGYVSPTANISSIQIYMVGNTNALLGLDELGFSVVPEPSAGALLLVGLAGMAAGRRHRRRP
jgi:hypothetical protein